MRIFNVVSFFITTWNHEDYTEHNPTQQTDSDVSEAEDKNEDGRGADGKVDDSESQMNSHDDRFKPPVQCTDDLASLAQAVHTDPNTGPATAASTSTVTPILPRPLPGMVRPRPAFHIVEQSLQELQDLEDTVPGVHTH
nr:hypothetical protein BaRGS_004886 [Batillaria attramentaria]